MRGRLGDSGILPLALLLSSGAEFEEVQRGGGAFSLSLLGAGEFLRGGVGGKLEGLGKAFTRVPRGAEMVYERLWRRMRMGLAGRLRSWSKFASTRCVRCWSVRLLRQPVDAGAARTRTSHYHWREHDGNLVKIANQACVCAWM